jgi:hypothetical protein
MVLLLGKDIEKENSIQVKKQTKDNLQNYISRHEIFIRKKLKILSTTIFHEKITKIFSKHTYNYNHLSP